jgi:hypothetical protein
MVGGAALLAPSAASAQVSGFAMNRYDPPFGGDLSFIGEMPWYSGSRNFLLRAALTADYAYQPLVLRNGDGDVVHRVVEHMLVGHLQVGVGLFDRFSVSLSLPMSLYQSGDATTPVSGQLRANGDVNVGDPVWALPARTPIPALLGGPPLEVLGYPLAMVVAEKLVTAVQRGRANTRWRDFADLWMLLGGPPATDAGRPLPAGRSARPLADIDVAEAIHAVASHRQASLEPLGPALAGMEREAQPRWAAWRKRQSGAAALPERLGDLIATIDARSAGWLSTAGPTVRTSGA